MTATPESPTSGHGGPHLEASRRAELVQEHRHRHGFRHREDRPRHHEEEIHRKADELGEPGESGGQGEGERANGHEDVENGQVTTKGRPLTMRAAHREDSEWVMATTDNINKERRSRTATQ